MGVFVAVVRDLYLFAFKYWFGFLSATPDKPQTSEKGSPVAAFVHSLQKVSAEVKTESTAHTLLVSPEAHPLLETRHESVGYAYIPDAFLYALPTRTFDGVITRMKYGESFQVLNSQGKWLNVLYKDVKGWVHMDNVTHSSASLNPQFTAGKYYDHNHSSTIKLRTLIDDEFHAAQLALPLQNVEYVLYLLHKKGNHIPWPAIRPRVAGTWQRLLKGIAGVHMGVTPKTGSVMESIHANNTGHVSYVHSVYPDGAITISEVGYPTEGVYSERTLSKNEWKELRPIFIEVL